MSAITLAGLVGGIALAQPAPPPAGPEATAATPPPAPGAGPGDLALAPLPPPPHRGFGAPPPPPPPGPHVIVDRGANGLVHVDVKCAERDSVQACAGIAKQMLDTLGVDAKGH